MTHNHLLKDLRSLGILLGFLLGGFYPSGLKADERPNVILIYTDDQGSIDANCYGATDLITPTFDKLAATGVRFTQMNAPSSVCSASRAGLMTGRIPLRAGVSGNVSSEKGHAGLPPHQLTIARLLKDSGYQTAHVGKWHLGYTSETMPQGHGFETTYGHMGGCIDNYSHFFYWQGPNRHDLWRNGEEIWEDGQYFPDRMAQECLEFLRQERDRPFFLYWALNGPHYPLQGTPKWREKYADLPAPRRMYAEFLSTVDERIGWVVDELEKQGLRENTIIIVQSDHGHSVEERTFSGGGNSGPYRGAKFSLFEGGLRVPSVVSWPGTIPQGEVRDQFVTACDWFPTIAEQCNVPLPKRKLDGKSIQQVILSEDAASPHESFYWQIANHENSQWSVRQGNWKLIGNPVDPTTGQPFTEQDRLYLTNLDEDIHEQQNFAEKYPEQVQKLLQIRQEYLRDIQETSAVEN